MYIIFIAYPIKNTAKVPAFTGYTEKYRGTVSGRKAACIPLNCSKIQHPGFCIMITVLVRNITVGGSTYCQSSPGVQ